MANYTLILGVLLAMGVHIDAWWMWANHDNSNCRARDGAKPYYFGKSDLTCLILKGKRAPERNTWSWSHGWLYYDGYYFDFHSYGARYASDSGTDCNPRQEVVPAGYGSVSVACLKRCADRYTSKYGKYNFLFNNCHIFANRLSKILCDSRECPAWCD